LTWKLAEDGEGSILRLLETEGRPVTANLSFPTLNMVSAWRCNAVEDKLHPLDVVHDNLRVNLKPFEILTIRVKTASKVQ
jgi:alpha-mannosidase